MADRGRFNGQMHHKSVARCFDIDFGYREENYSLRSKSPHTSVASTTRLCFPQRCVNGFTT